MQKMDEIIFSPEIAETLSAGIRTFFCSENTCSAKDAPLPASSARIEHHPFPEFLFAVCGSASFVMNAAEIRVNPGDFCLIPPWMPHQNGYQTEDAGLLHIWFGISNGIFYYNVVQPNGTAGEYAILSRGRLPNVLLSAYSLIKNGDAARQIPFFNFLLSETREVLARIADGEQDSTKKEELTESLKYFIENRNGTDCSLATLEKHFGYSRSHLSHLFHETEGVSIGSYIDRIRMNYTIAAKKQGFKQKEIAAGLGFSSPSAFWLWLRKQRGAPIRNSAKPL